MEELANGVIAFFSLSIRPSVCLSVSNALVKIVEKWTFTLLRIPQRFSQNSFLKRFTSEKLKLTFLKTSRKTLKSRIFICKT